MPQLTFLPWLRVDDQEKFGQVTLIPKGAALGELKGHDREYADAMCAAYVELHANKEGLYDQVPVTFVRYKDAPLTTTLSDTNFEAIARALRVLGAVAQEVRGFGFTPANAFVPIGQLYQDQGFSLAIFSGRVRSGGLDMRKVRFSRPAFIPTNTRLDVGEKALRTAAQDLLGVDNPTRRQLALLRAMEWSFWANIDTDEQNSFVRFVLLLTAFESVLDRRSTALGFAYALHERLATMDDAITARVIDGHEHTLNEQGWWAYSFYKFRSDTVHGQPLPAGALYNGHSHFYLASIAFRVVVRQELSDLGLLNNPLGIFGADLFLELLRKGPEADQ